MGVADVAKRKSDSPRVIFMKEMVKVLEEMNLAYDNASIDETIRILELEIDRLKRS